MNKKHKRVTAYLSNTGWDSLEQKEKRFEGEKRDLLRVGDNEGTMVRLGETVCDDEGTW